MSVTLFNQFVLNAKNLNFSKNYFHFEILNFKHNDLLVPWKNKSDEETFHRFYHVFEEGALESLMYEALGKDKMEIESLFYDQGNWCVIFVKKQ